MRKQERNRVIMIAIGMVLALSSGYFRGNVPSDYNPWLLGAGIAIAVVPVYRQIRDLLR